MPRILLASTVAPLAAAVPIAILGFFMWSYAINEPFAKSELSAVTRLSFAVLSTMPIYGGLAFGFLVVSLLLRVFKRLTLKALLVVSAAISLAAGVVVGSGAFAYAAPWEAVLNLLLMSLVSFAILAGVSASWWRLAERRNLRAPQQRGAGEA
jgi:hypothetical protein